MVAALVVVIWCLLIAWVIRWRSAPPPPPDVHIPGGMGP